MITGTHRLCSERAPSRRFALAVLLVGCGSDAHLRDQDATGAREDRTRDGGAAEDVEATGTPRLDGGAPTGASAGDDPISVVAEGLEVEWSNCSLYTGQRTGERPPYAEQTDGGVPVGPPPATAKCATLALPLRWEEVEGPLIDWFVKKVPAAETSRGQLWLLQGGPGSAGAGLDHLADRLHEAVPDLDIYIPDHRGVGRSTFFDCDEAGLKNEKSITAMKACGEELARDWGTDTNAFNASSAAKDVVTVATHLHRQGQEVIVWGGSYGGYLAHRVLQVDRQRLFTAALLDSAALPIGGLSTAYQTLKPSHAGDALLAACAEDEECSARLGSDPRQRAIGILDDLCQPVSAEFGGRAGMQFLLSGAIRQWRLLRFIPAMLYRAARCSDGDLEMLRRFADETNGYASDETDEAPASRAIFVHIMFGEIIDVLSAREDVIAASEASVFSDILGEVDMQAALAQWPRYPADEFMGRWADTEVPMLILHGVLDTQTPLGEGEAIAEQFTGDLQHAFVMPTGGHGAYYRSHDVSEDDHTSCGAYLTHQFLREPQGPIDGRCVDAAPAIDFTDEETSLELFGQAEVWDNPSGDAEGR